MIVEIQDFPVEKEEKKHSPFSASGSERWEECPGEPHLSKGIIDRGNIYTIEGTKAHGVLERIMRAAMRAGYHHVEKVIAPPTLDRQMVGYGREAANFILALGHKLTAEVMVETRVHLKFIHPEMFGTFDGAVIDHFGTLHVFDYKYGRGHAVHPKENLQMIFYGIGLAHLYGWNFARVRLWIIQPRVKGYDGPMFWEIPITGLKQYVARFKRAVQRSLDNPTLYIEGSWCHWCKAKKICPLKREARVNEATNIFGSVPVEGMSDGFSEEGHQEESKKEGQFEGWRYRRQT